MYYLRVMKKILFILSVLTICSCSKDDSGAASDSDINEFSITAYAPGYDPMSDTKSETLGFWSQGDEVSVVNTTTGKYLGNMTAFSVSFTNLVADFSGTLKGGISENDCLAFIYPAMPLQDSLPRPFFSYPQPLSGQFYNPEDRRADFSAVGYTHIYSLDLVSYDVDFSMMTSYLVLSVGNIPERVSELESVTVAGVGDTIVWTLVDGVLVPSVGDDGSIDVTCQNVQVTGRQADIVVSVPESSEKEMFLSLSDGYFVYRSRIPAIEILPGETYIADCGPLSLVNGFSIAQDSIVAFSRGNLQVDTSAVNWSFAPEQYDFIGAENVNDSTLESVVDLFGWSGAGATVGWGIGSSISDDDYSGEFENWGNNTYLHYLLGSGWRTLSSDGWNYLLSLRRVSVGGESKEPYGHARVMGIPGLLILPDGWDGSICPHFVYGNSSYANSFDSSSVPSWKDMEYAGCVFLPAAGSRYGLNYSEGYGGYWSSTSSETSKYYMSFEDGGIQTRDEISPSFGLSVRLVHP